MKGSGKVTYTYHGNPYLRAAGVTVQWSAEQAEEIFKCRKDPIYFIENYVKVRNIGFSDYIPLKLYGFQKKLIKSFHENRFTIGLTGRQQGKCLESTTYATFLNKHTKEKVTMQVGDFFNLTKNKSKRLPSRHSVDLNSIRGMIIDYVKNGMRILFKRTRKKEEVL